MIPHYPYPGTASPPPPDPGRSCLVMLAVFLYLLVVLADWLFYKALGW